MYAIPSHTIIPSQNKKLGITAYQLREVLSTHQRRHETTIIVLRVAAVALTVFSGFVLVLNIADPPSAALKNIVFCAAGALFAAGVLAGAASAAIAVLKKRHDEELIHIKSKYDQYFWSDSILPSELDLRIVIAKLSGKALSELLARLNFYELCLAKSILGSKSFKRNINLLSSRSLGEQHAMWKILFTLPKSAQKIKEIEKILSKEEVRYFAGKEALFLNKIRDKLRGISDKNIQMLLQNLQPVSQAGSLVDSKMIQIRKACEEPIQKVDEQSILIEHSAKEEEDFVVVPVDLLSNNSVHFKNLFETYKEETVFEYSAEEYDNLKIFIAQIAGRGLNPTAENIRKLVKLADYYMSASLYEQIDGMIVCRPHFSDYELLKLASEHPELKLTKEFAIKKFWNIEITSENWKLMLNYSNEFPLLNETSLRKRCDEFITKSIEEASESGNAKDCLRYLDMFKANYDKETFPEMYRKICKAIYQRMSPETVNLIYSYSISYPDNGDLKNACLRFCGKYAETMRVKIAVNEIERPPKEIMDILFPELP